MSPLTPHDYAMRWKHLSVRATYIDLCATQCVTCAASVAQARTHPVIADLCATHSAAVDAIPGVGNLRQMQSIRAHAHGMRRIYHFVTTELELRARLRYGAVLIHQAKRTNGPTLGTLRAHWHALNASRVAPYAHESRVSLLRRRAQIQHALAACEDYSTEVSRHAHHLERERTAILAKAAARVDKTASQTPAAHDAPTRQKTFIA